jgi:hypothetical protein
MWICGGKRWRWQFVLVASETEDRWNIKKMPVWGGNDDENAFDWSRGKVEVDWGLIGHPVHEDFPEQRLLSPCHIGNSQGKRPKLSPERRRSGHNLGKPDLDGSTFG